MKINKVLIGSAISVLVILAILWVFQDKLFVKDQVIDQSTGKAVEIPGHPGSTITPIGGVIDVKL